MMRFSLVRPFQRQGSIETRNRTIHSQSEFSNSALYQALKAAKDAGSRDRMLAEAAGYRKGESLLDRGLTGLTAPLAAIDAFLLARPETSVPELTVEVDRLCSAAGLGSWKAWLTGSQGVAECVRLHDALLACAIGGEYDARARRSRPELLRGVRLRKTLEWLVAPDPALTAPGGLNRALRAIVLLPKALFPLPGTDGRQAADERRAEEASRVEASRTETLEALQEIDNLRHARDDLHRVHAQIARPERARERAARLGRVEDAYRPGMLGGLIGGGRRREDPRLEEGMVTERSKEYQLTDEAAGALTKAAQETLRREGHAPGALDVRAATAALDRRIDALSTQLHRSAPRHATVQAGRNFISAAVLGPRPPAGTMLLQAQPGDVEIGVAVPTLPSPGLPSTLPSVPVGHGDVRPIGWADLLIVREETMRYEDGEVAHIENVLKGERRVRTHSRTDERETTLTIARESVTESERDLQTTDRFQLEATAERELQSKVEVEAGVEATYSGGTVEIKANAGFAYERASQESARTATTVAHEVTDRTVSRVREAVREERVTRTRETVSEENRHEVDNTETPNGHVVGIYRWVNAVHRAEMANYGRRLMFEFVVPEPAALFGHAQASAATEAASIDKPEPPVYLRRPWPLNKVVGLGLDDLETRPLRPSDLSAVNYLHWVSKYNVQDVEPPPPEFKTVGIAISEQPAGTGNRVAASVGDLTVPDGYRAESATITPTFIRHSGGYVRVAVGQQNTEYWGGTRDLALNDEDGKIPVTVCYYHIAALSLTIEVTCRLSPARFQAWQLKTYAAIINAYNLLKSEYEEQLASARIQAGVTIQGRNPQRNREIERTELKRAALTVLTGQHFDLFDAMETGPGPLGYPQMNIAEAAAEGRYMQFFEQAFEWPSMSYMFYPYFWGRKAGWIDRFHLEDPDPKFELFLRAGAARILVPVRPGYEHAILHYIETDNGETWDGGDPPHVDDPLYLSIADAIKEDQGNYRVPGIGALALTHNDPHVSGAGTAFNVEDDENREIAIRGTTYRIHRVLAPDSIDLDRPYAGATATAEPFELGLRYIGQPWFFTLPTPLVHLQKSPDLPTLRS